MNSKEMYTSVDNTIECFVNSKHRYFDFIV